MAIHDEGPLLEFVHQQPLAAGAIGVVVALLLLYLARRPMHRLLRSSGRFLQGALRLFGAWVEVARQRLRARNEATRLAVSLAGIEARLQKEFATLDGTMRRELEAFPDLRRELNELMESMERDYQDSVAVPPLPAPWAEATTAITKLRKQDDSATATVLEGVGTSLTKAQGRAFRLHQRDSRRRYRRLQALLPRWRRIQTILGSLETHVAGLESRSEHIEQLLEQYEALTTQRAGEGDRLRCPYLTRFLVSTAVLGLLGLVAVVNAGLLAYPMQEFTGAHSYLGPWRTADVAALVMVGLGAMAGLVLVESTGVTRLLPALAVMDERLRVIFTILAGGVLLLLAALGASLGYLHQTVLLEVSTLSAELSGLAAASEPHGVAVVSHTLLGFTLPLILAFTAIPLQTFLQNAQVVFGDALELLLMALSSLLRQLARLVRGAFELLVRLYDLAIFPPLWLEGAIAGQRGRKA